MIVSRNRILDEKGRTLILRGCNLGGSSKLPYAPTEAKTQGPNSLKSPESVSFAGRPFPLEEADKHFRRLSGWGFNFLRLVVTWEALEHAGPGIYDEEYLAYLRKLLLTAEKYGISVFIDPHQDVWSRWTGGDGAPAWTLEKLGMNVEKLDECGAAVTQQNFRGLDQCKPYWETNGKVPFFWPINYSRYAAATLFTLFFAGSTYAPDIKMEGKPVQEWYQEKYIAAFQHCKRRLKYCGAIAGWGVWNEPHPGFIGCANLDKLSYITLKLGPVPSPLQAMAAASGHSVKCSLYSPYFNNPRKNNAVTINPNRVNLFREGFSCPWKQQGVWTDEGGIPKPLKTNHFAFFEGRPADFTNDFLKPFTVRFIDKMKEAEKPPIFFIEGVADGTHPAWQSTDGENIVNAFHHYDGPTLFLRDFHPHFTADPKTGKFIVGRKNVKALWNNDLASAVKWSKEKMGDMPALIGEFGLPFNLKRKRAYRTGNYRLHEEALSLYFDGIDKNLLHSTIWNYTSDNDHDYGDQWNGEDFSIYHKGEGRAINGWLRPYPMATSGEPISVKWNRKKLLFGYRYKADPSIDAPTEIYVPLKILGNNPKAAIHCDEPGLFRYELVETEPSRILIYNLGFSGEVDVIISG